MNEELKAVYKDMYQAMIHKDTKELDRILDDAFVLVHMTGMHQSKKAFIEAVKNGTLNYYSEDTDDIAISIHEDQAEIIGKSRVNAAVFGGGRYTWRLEQDLTLHKTKEGNWKVTRSIASTY